MELKGYQSVLFDCDGVLLDSNHIKTEVFYKIALKYGQNAADEFVKYHKKNAGRSRYSKFYYLHKVILKKNRFDRDVEKDIKEFGESVTGRLINCPETEGMRNFVQYAAGSCNCYIVSGGDERELNKIFDKRDLAHFFKGIYGSPSTKEQILEKLLIKKKIVTPVLYIGDSQYDYEVASRYGFDFVFMSGYTEMKNWQDYFKSKPEIKIIKRLNGIKYQ